ncbi:MAG: hypothetical protein HY438_00350 [DPANN group archaeon]|nr:hypothetical protein [DPANN group archaeon]
MQTLDNINKHGFLLWFYHSLDSTGKSLDTWGKHYAISIIEKELNARGFTTGYKFAERVFGPYAAQLQEDFKIMGHRLLLHNDLSRSETPASPMLTKLGAERFETFHHRHLEKALGAHYPDLERLVREIVSLSPKEILQRANT